MGVDHNQCRIDLVTEKSQFELLKKDWDRLLAGGDYDITVSWEWLFSWWEIYHKNRELFIVTFTINHNMVAIFPFQRVIDNRYLLNRKIIRFLGTGENEKDETCSEYINLIIASEYRGQVISAFVEFLQNRPSDWHCVLLTDVRSTSPNLLSMSQQKISGVTTRIEKSVHNAPYIDLPESWETLLSVTRINAREQLNRKYNLLKQQGDITFKKYQGVEILDSVYDSFVELHQKRWESTDKPGCFSSELFTAFHKKLIARLADSNQAMIFFLCVDDKAIAARYCFVMGDKTYDYQTGLDMDFETKSSPGTVLLAHVIRDRINHKNHQYDFFKGKKDAYKYKWTDKDQALVTLILCRKSISNIMFNILDFKKILSRMVRVFFR